jgi:hypothetical protein
VADSLIEMGSAHWPDSGVTLTDHGYMEAQARASKRERNLELLRRAHREQPDSLYTAYKLAITLPGQAAEERLAVLVSAMKRAKSTTTDALLELPFLPRLVEAAVDGLVGAGRLAEAVDVASHFCERLDAAAHGHYALLAGCTFARSGMAAQARTVLGSWVGSRRRLNRWRPLHRTTDEPLSDGGSAAALQWLAWLSLQEGDRAAASRWIEEGRALTEGEMHQGLEQVGLQCALEARDFEAVSRGIEALERRISRTPALAATCMPLMMWASARLALAMGDAPLSRQLAQQSHGLVDDVGVLLMAELDLLVVGRLDAETLRNHYASLAGRRCDALAFKLLIGQRLGLNWPHPVPASLNILTWAGPAARLWGLPM